MKKIEYCEFYEEKFDFVVGEELTRGFDYYSACALFNKKEYKVGIINRDFGLKPQFEQYDNLVIVGHNNKVSLIDLSSKSVREFEIFPVFFEFFKYGEKIVVVGEIQVLCIANNKVIWEKSFDDIIDVVTFKDGKLTIRKWESQEWITMDADSGAIIPNDEY